MLHGIVTDPDTGASHGVLSAAQRRKMAETKSLCIELVLVPGDPRATDAKLAAEKLTALLAWKPVAKSPADAPEKEPNADASK